MVEKRFNEVFKMYSDRLDELLGDPLLMDLPCLVTLDEVSLLV